MNRNLVVEIHEFSPIEGISDDALLKALRKAEISFFRHQLGFLRCEVLHSENVWFDLAYWQNEDIAREAFERFLDHSSRFPLIQMVSPLTYRRLYLTRVLTCTGLFSQ